VVYDPSNTPVDPSVLERVMARLSQRGPDGRDGCLTGQAALGHWHFWTTPEEVGERQPLALAGLPFKIVLDGRLDNRLELSAELRFNPAEEKSLSDAALILHAYDRWGEHCFQHFIGAFALVIWNERSGELLFARDALGDRTLFYSWKGTRLVIASEPWAAAGADGSGTELNESAVAHNFALRVAEEGQTLFKNVYEVAPAHAMLVNASGQRTWCYWQPDPSKRVRYNSDEEYAEEFRGLLEQSVRCRMRATTPVGVLMSGGLDSGSVACLAARMLQPQPLTTISYVFDELAECDERRYIETVKEKWSIHSIQIPCDDAWPLKDWTHWPSNPNHPEGNPYRMLKERAYERAHTEGLRVLFTGAFGDELYDGEEDWLADLLAEGRWQEAGRELKSHLEYAGLLQTLGSDYVRRTGRRLLNRLPGGRRVLSRKPGPAPDWLTPFAAGQLSKDKVELEPAFERKKNTLGRWAAADCSYEIPNANRHALELRHPYRDRRLVEFVLTLPAYQLYNHGLYKHILRVAMQGILPEAIRTRDQPTYLGPLYLRGFVREKKVQQACFQDSAAGWRRFVSVDWLSGHWKRLFSLVDRRSDVLVPWLCMTYELWSKSLVLSTSL
jgi:asparagine synthase (glutamine-hydrolysing)